MAENSSGIPVKRRATSCINDQSLNLDGKLQKPKSQTKFETSHKTEPTEKSDSLAQEQLTSQSSFDRNNEMKETLGRCYKHPLKEDGDAAVKEERLKDAGSATERPNTLVDIHDSGQTVLYYLVLIFMTALGLLTRLYRIEIPPWIWYGCSVTLISLLPTIS